MFSFGESLKWRRRRECDFVQNSSDYSTKREGGKDLHTNTKNKPMFAKTGLGNCSPIALEDGSCVGKQP